MLYLATRTTSDLIPYSRKFINTSILLWHYAYYPHLATGVSLFATTPNRPYCQPFVWGIPRYSGKPYPTRTYRLFHNCDAGQLSYFINSYNKPLCTLSILCISRPSVSIWTTQSIYSILQINKNEYISIQYCYYCLSYCSPIILSKSIIW